jgi:hypothetical protein
MPAGNTKVIPCWPLGSRRTTFAGNGAEHPLGWFFFYCSCHIVNPREHPARFSSDRVSRVRLRNFHPSRILYRIRRLIVLEISPSIGV